MIKEGEELNNYLIETNLGQDIKNRNRKEVEWILMKISINLLDSLIKQITMMNCQKLDRAFNFSNVKIPQNQMHLDQTLLKSSKLIMEITERYLNQIQVELLRMTLQRLTSLIHEKWHDEHSSSILKDMMMKQKVYQHRNLNDWGPNLHLINQCKKQITSLQNEKNL